MVSRTEPKDYLLPWESAYEVRILKYFLKDDLLISEKIRKSSCI